MSAPRRFNTDAPHCVHSNEVVAKARRMRAQRRTVRAISAELAVPLATVSSWIYTRRRPAPV